jgi:GTP pyrophosphokinase
MQREGQSGANLDELAHKLGFANADALYLAAARNDIGQRQLQTALRGAPEEAPAGPEIQTRRSKAAAPAGC